MRWRWRDLSYRIHICVINDSTLLRVAFLLHYIHLISSPTKSLIIPHELSHYYALLSISYPFLSIPPFQFQIFRLNPLDPTISNPAWGHPTSPPLASPVVPLAVAPLSHSARCPWSTSRLPQKSPMIHWTDAFWKLQVRKWTKSEIWDMVHRFVPENLNVKVKGVGHAFFDVGQLGLDFGFLILGAFFQWDILWKSKWKVFRIGSI